MSKTLGVCGFGFSGSGAVVDLLKNNINICYPRIGEFTLTYLPDGLKDLKYNLFDNCSRFFSADVGILRFRRRVLLFCKEKKYDKNTTKKIMTECDNFISQISNVQWLGFWKYDYQECTSLLNKFIFRIRMKINKLLKQPEKYKPYRKMFFSIKPSCFLDCAKTFLKNVLSILGVENNRTILLDQNVPSNNPLGDLLYYDDAKIIIVDRDPRDMYLLAKKTLRQEASWIPTDDVYNFIKYYKLMRLNDDIQDERILRLQFEDLIYKTDDAIKRIEEFIGFKVDIESSGFNPRISINNTQLFLSNNHFANEISLIENELKPYLYDYSLYDIKPNNNTKIF